MDSQRFVFDDVTALTAVAVGQPGQRKFYIVVGQVDAWVRFWLEKEELNSLSAAFSELIETVADSGLQPPLTKDDRAPAILFEPPYAPTANFKSIRLAVGYDQSLDRIAMFVNGPEASDDAPTLVCWLTRIQARTLGDRINLVCGAGRTACILCGAPIDPEGHICPRSNGHGPKEL
ncbi:MAG: DUF3090 family protein [Dehalococcoidia bacterium]|nr:DUF3090 family protein [Dehalococcoidia bacterium]